MHEQYAGARQTAGEGVAIEFTAGGFQWGHFLDHTLPRVSSHREEEGASRICPGDFFRDDAYSIRRGRHGVSRLTIMFSDVRRRTGVNDVNLAGESPAPHVVLRSR
jgi:hypothetical protein